MEPITMYNFQVEAFHTYYAGGLGVLVHNASNEYKNKRFKNILSEENQNKIVNTYKDRKEIEGFSKIVSINQIKENDYNLSIKKYIRKNSY